MRVEVSQRSLQEKESNSVSSKASYMDNISRSKDCSRIEIHEETSSCYCLLQKRPSSDKEY